MSGGRVCSRLSQWISAYLLGLLQRLIYEAQCSAATCVALHSLRDLIKETLLVPLALYTCTHHETGLSACSDSQWHAPQG